MSHKKYALFVGRYQALHEGHKYLFRKKIEEGIPVFVWVRNVPKDDKNPFNQQQVMELFMNDEETKQWLDDGMMLVGGMPDVEGIYYGRDVGYKVEQIEVPKEIADISATKIREEMREKGLL
jgi:FAD synthase